MAADLTATHGTQLDSGILLRKFRVEVFFSWVFCFIFLFFKKFYYLGLCWAFFAVHGLSLAAASRRYYLVAVRYFGL